MPTEAKGQLLKSADWGKTGIFAYNVEGDFFGDFQTLCDMPCMSFFDSILQFRNIF